MENKSVLMNGSNNRLTRKNFILWLLPSIILFLTVLVFFPNNKAHFLFLEYLKTLSNWPLSILIVCMFICIRFYSAVDYKIRTLLVKTPKGYVIGDRPSQQTAGALLNEKIEQIEKGQIDKELFLLKIIKFERFVRLTYKSQFQLLKYLETGPQLWDRTILFYWNYIINGGNKDYGIDQYISWLSTKAGFIETKIVNNAMFMNLTDEGRNFLSYCITMSYSENTFIPL